MQVTAPVFYAEVKPREAGLVLLCPQCNNRILAGCHTRWYQSCDKREEYTYQDQGGSSDRRQYCLERGYSCEPDQYSVDRNQKYQTDAYAYKAGTETDNDSLCVKDSGYILLRSSYRSQYADLLSAFKYRNVRDNTDHDRRNYE